MCDRKPARSVLAGVASGPSVDVTPRAMAVPTAPQKGPTISHHRKGRLSINLYNNCTRIFTAWFGSRPTSYQKAAEPRRATAPLYTPEERRRRDLSPWTIVQAALAPIQFFIFAVSLCLVVRYLMTGEGLALATASIVLKTIALYAIMITGSIWEREVFGRYLFARPFFWEDVFSILVLALHTLYLAALISGVLAPRQQMLVVLAAYASYVINATQFILKLRSARRQQPAPDVGAMGLAS
jgi:3-vinyl bacteriochlorophyllide hydratase